MVTEENKSIFQNKILAWFVSEKRDFPWRQDLNPYKVLIAEKLLQQTQVNENVIRAYKQLLKKYPSPTDLAEADIADVEVIIRPLGFIYRARELCKMAQELVKIHNGQVPNELRKLLDLTGIGDYCARAVLSFSFDKDVPIVDTNVARFLYRLYEIPGPFPSNPARKKSLIELAGNLVPIGNSRNYNLAILDLCSKICKPTNPNCLNCPVQDFCKYGTKQIVKKNISP
ncbi:A/G-specific adenine glycosylase [candidate division KSB1 bacterium]|nr:A/G-specific adenine glycosylase [candidate division KSB1 bacterium]